MCSRGGYRGDFCDKGVSASPMFDGANANWLQDGPTARQELISASDSTLGITELGRGGNSCATANAAREQ